MPSPVPGPKTPYPSCRSLAQVRGQPARTHVMAQDELFVQQHCREYGNKRHVVSKANSPSGAAFFEQFGGGCRIEIPRLRDLLRAEKLGHVVYRFARVEKTLAVRSAVGLLSAGSHGFRQ